MAMHVISPGPRTTIQDKGRLGYQNSGFAPSGFMDRVASRMANVLVGNHDSDAVLEFCLIGPELYFDETVNIAVCGGDFGINAGGRIYPANKAVHVPAGVKVRITTGKVGIYGSLAVGGGLDIPMVMGSRSTNLRCGIGGYKGRALMAGDVIALRNPENGRQDLSWRWVPPRRLVSPDDPEITKVRVIAGPQEDMFTQEGLRTFYESTYVITSHSDRMGYRLKGPKVEAVSGYDPLFAQLRPGQKVTFVKCSVQEAQKLIREADKKWKEHCRILEKSKPAGFKALGIRAQDNDGGSRSGWKRSGWKQKGWKRRSR